jgi:hypothetical protein
MIKKYPDINRTGCAMLYVAQKSHGDERARYLQDCIEKFGECMYGDGVQVGAYARFLLAEDYKIKGEDNPVQAVRRSTSSGMRRSVVSDPSFAPRNSS